MAAVTSAAHEETETTAVCGLGCLWHASSPSEAHIQSGAEHHAQGHPGHVIHVQTESRRTWTVTGEAP